jgi:hypothetical protein
MGTLLSLRTMAATASNSCGTAFDDPKQERAGWARHATSSALSRYGTGDGIVIRRAEYFVVNQ